VSLSWQGLLPLRRLHRHGSGRRYEYGPFGARIVIGVLDLLTRTPWRLEITLPSDAAYFTARSIWHNATPMEGGTAVARSGIETGGRICGDCHPRGEDEHA